MMVAGSGSIVNPPRDSDEWHPPSSPPASSLGRPNNEANDGVVSVLVIAAMSDDTGVTVNQEWPDCDGVRLARTALELYMTPVDTTHGTSRRSIEASLGTTGASSGTTRPGS